MDKYNVNVKISQDCYVKLYKIISDMTKKDKTTKTANAIEDCINHFYDSIEKDKK